MQKRIATATAKQQRYLKRELQKLGSQKKQQRHLRKGIKRVNGGKDIALEVKVYVVVRRPASRAFFAETNRTENDRERCEGSEGREKEAVTKYRVYGSTITVRWAG